MNADINIATVAIVQIDDVQVLSVFIRGHLWLD